MMWVMATAMRLAGNKEGKGEGGKVSDIGDEGGKQGRGQRRQGNGNGNKGGGQVDSDGDK